MKKNKTQLTIEKVQKYILENFDGLSLKMEVLDYCYGLKEILKESKKLKNANIHFITLNTILNNLSLLEIKKFSDFKAFEKNLNNILDKRKLFGLVREDFLDSINRKIAIDLYYQANPDIENFDKCLEAYLELHKLSKNNKQLQDFKKIKENELNKLFIEGKSLINRSVYLNDLIDKIYVDYLDTNDEALRKHWGINGCSRNI